MKARRLASLAALLLAALGAAGCTVGQGEGWVRSDQLLVPECWHGPFDLGPDFFATMPFRDTQQIRVQRGTDLTEVSDGVAIEVNEVATLRAEQLGQNIPVGLSPELWSDVNPTADPGPEPQVTLALYLQFSCHDQNSVLYATRGVIKFLSLFSGDPQETTGSEKLTEAFFDVDVGFPRDAPPGSTEVPEDKLSRLTGYFRFHFVRGQPGQPFP